MPAVDFSQWGPVEQKPLASVDLTGSRAKDPASMLKDPNNILSKRSIYYDYDKFDVKDEYRGIVEAHGGTLSAENIPGSKPGEVRGARFVVALPAER